VQFLTSALPGFRDLRPPLVAGYLWLVFLWILIKPDIHKRPANEVAAAVYDLAKDAGPIWIGAAIGVAAYLVGSVSQALSPVIGHKGLLSIRNKVLPSRFARPEIDLLGRYLEEARRKVTMEIVEQHEDAARGGLDDELELPATLLLGKEPDERLFSEADRLQAERELRLAVVPPLSVIAILLACNQSRLWWLALIPVAVLLWQGHSRNEDFRSLMLGAMDRGLAVSRYIDEFKRWVEALPEPSSEQKGEGRESPDLSG
jgi:hypothetical protein